MSATMWSVSSFINGCQRLHFGSRHSHVVKCTCGCQVKPQRFPPEIINDCDTQLNVKLEGLSLVRRFKQRNRICVRNQHNYVYCPKLLEKWGEGGGRKSAASTKLILFNYCRNLHEQIQNMPSQIPNSSLVKLTSCTKYLFYAFHLEWFKRTHVD